MTDRPAELGTLRVNLTWSSFLFLGIFALAAFVRVLNLDVKTLHHDESLYATYAWQLYDGRGHHYDPMQHGPLMFHVAAWLMFLFGDSDNTVRMVSVLLSMVMLAMLWAWRHEKEMGEGTALISVSLYAFTPMLLYFNRFFREDTPFAFCMLGVPTCYLLYRHTQRQSWLVLMAVSFAGMFCTKENAFVSAIIFIGYALVSTAQRYHASGRRWSAVTKVIEDSPYLSLWLAYVVLWGIGFMGFAVPHALDVKLFSTKEPQNVTNAGVAFFMALNGAFVLLTAGLYALANRVEKTGVDSILGLSTHFYREVKAFCWSFFAFGVTCTLLYTNFFQGSPQKTAFRSFIDGCGLWFVYWYNQHSMARIRAPFYYYFVHEYLYEPLTLVLVLGGVAAFLVRKPLIAAVTAGFFMFAVVADALNSRIPGGFPIANKLVKLEDNLFLFSDLMVVIGLVLVGIMMVWTLCEENKPLRAFLVGWTVLAFCIYSYLQEKVPWLGMHILMPMHLYAAMVLRDLFQKGVSKGLQVSAATVLTILGLYGFRSSVLLNFYNSDNAVEQAVYVQSNREVKFAVAEIERIARFTGLYNNLEIACAGEPTWPMSWYLRHYPVYWADVDKPDKAVILTSLTSMARYEPMMKDYVGHRYQLRSWWIPTVSDWLTIRNFQGGPNGNWEGFKNYILFRRPWRPETMYGSTDFLMLVHRDIYKTHTWNQVQKAGDAPWVQNQRWKAPPPRKVISSDVKRLKPLAKLVFGSKGSAAGQFQEPKGIVTDAQGNIFVADSANHRVEKFDAQGHFLSAIGGPGDGDGQFSFPTGMAMDDKGLLYVCDTWHHRIQVFDAASGNFVRAFGSSKDWWAPKAVVWDGQTGNLIVGVPGSHRCFEVSSEGAIIRAIGDPAKGADPGHMDEPVGVLLDNTGSVLVADTNNHRIQVFTRDGAYQRSYAIPEGWEHFSTEPFLGKDSAGRIYYTDATSHRLGVLSPQGKLIAYIGTQGKESGQFEAPRGLWIDQQGQIYVADTLNHRIQIFGPVAGLP